MPFTSKCSRPSPQPIHPAQDTTNAALPLHLVGLVALAQAERTCQIAGEHVNLLDVGQESLVDSLLIRRSAAADLLLLYRFHPLIQSSQRTQVKKGGG